MLELSEMGEGMGDIYKWKQRRDNKACPKYFNSNPSISTHALQTLQPELTMFFSLPFHSPFYSIHPPLKKIAKEKDNPAYTNSPPFSQFNLDQAIPKRL